MERKGKGREGKGREGISIYISNGRYDRVWGWEAVHYVVGVEII
jgi:hypothetical protein